MSNRLAQEQSLYLKQHAANPVHWWPWGADAFAAAQAQGKPVLVSVGYSSCHWCHVMARESFEQPYIAELMNQHFICIKVDREERPEVDKLMMDAVQMINGHGGWPLNCFCLPDGRPFFGGTYFPPDDRGHGQVPWPQLLMRVSDFFHRNKDELAANADAIAQNLTHLTRAPDADGSSPQPADLLAAAKRLCEQHDDTYGGFGGAPKFPSPPTVDFLLAIRGTAAAEQDRALATRLDAVLTVTLGGMARGGLFDQIGGGFHRYCVDRDWTVPHFEKMLYDNAQLLGTYAEAWARYRDPLYARVCAETIGWLQREMRLPNGLYASALDADTHHEEGTTYVWKPVEIVALLGAEALPFAAAYGLTDQGNFEGANIPKLRAKTAERDRLAGARAQLLAARNLRPQPERDDKALLGWNALLIRALAKAAWIFGRKDWFVLAADLEAHAWQLFAAEGASPTLRSVAHGDQASLTGNLTDYAWFAQAELALAAYASWGLPNESQRFSDRARALMQATTDRFADPHAVGFFFAPAGRDDLSVRQKDWFDNAVPAGNSAMIHVCAEAYTLTGEDRWRQTLEDLAQAYSGMARNVPNGVAHALEGLTHYAMGHAVLKHGPGTNLDALQATLSGQVNTSAHARPHRRVLLVPSPETLGFQLCVGPTCQAPTNDLAEIADAL
ncbi:MAG: thioredoxin domain-containing protein [Verrucomicrobia bacterium]|nr:thioredoxin domain-containing protein [Verrucomicrobiota bacterium]